MAHTCNSNTWEAKGKRILVSLRLLWATYDFLVIFGYSFSKEKRQWVTYTQNKQTTKKIHKKTHKNDMKIRGTWEEEGVQWEWGKDNTGKNSQIHYIQV